MQLGKSGARFHNTRTVRRHQDVVASLVNRANNKWYLAESTGIYCSVILRPALASADVLVLSLAARLAVHSAVSSMAAGILPDSKWANNLLIDDKQFCGILPEMSALTTPVGHIVVGVGINVNQTKFPEDLQPIAPSLRVTTGSEWSRYSRASDFNKAGQSSILTLLSHPNAHADILLRFEQNSSMVSRCNVHVQEKLWIQHSHRKPGISRISEGAHQRRRADCV